MTSTKLFDPINNRVALDKEEGDIAYFGALALKLEYLTKIVAAGIVACIGDDVDRHRYTLEHKLVRANAVGDWVDVLNKALTGPPAQFLDVRARNVVRDLTERVGDGDWRYTAVSKLNRVAEHLGIPVELGSKAAFRQFFDLGARIRNRTRGHGATTSSQCSLCCPLLDDTLTRAARELELFRLSWAYLHRNLSGKYRVSVLLGNSAPFGYLKRSREERLPSGVFFYLDGPVHVPLIFSDQDLSDVFLPNGNHRNSKFEILSYTTNTTSRQDATQWANPPARLPPSETEGKSNLDPLGNVFANLPPERVGYVPRSDLESILVDELSNTDRHPIVSLTGPGGIGKTTTALAALRQIAHLDEPPYDVLVWISARDVDLLEHGPKPVSPRVVTQVDIANAVVEFLQPSDRTDGKFRAQAYMEQCLAVGAGGPTLFVIDNFETVQSPADVFRWLDTHVRPPNKVLVTTRFREFVGDYPIDVPGMTDEEAATLIEQHSTRLGVGELVDAKYKNELVRESDGHPYVIKILLGQVASEGRAVTPKRIVASADHLLQALFERTYIALSPAAQRVFLLLCSWRNLVPEIAVEAVSLRPGNERFPVAKALSELRRFSLTDQVVSPDDEQIFVGIPLAGTMYGRSKLETSPFKVAVEADLKLLKEFGTGRREDVRRGVLPRIERLVRNVAYRARRTKEALEESLPVMEYLAARVPKAYMLLAELILEVDNSKASIESAKEYMRRFLEYAPAPERQGAWLRLAELCRTSGDAVGEVHALSEAALLPTMSQEDIGWVANELNKCIWELRGARIEDAWSVEVRELLGKVIEKMETQLKTLSATDCSRLAWLYLNVGNEDRARDVAKVGLETDSTNEYCKKLIKRLGA